MLYSHNRENKEKIYDLKRTETETMLHNLDQMKEIILGDTSMENDFKGFHEEFDRTFINDEEVTGKWEINNVSARQ